MSRKDVSDDVDPEMEAEREYAQAQSRLDDSFGRAPQGDVGVQQMRAAVQRTGRRALSTSEPPATANGVVQVPRWQKNARKSRTKVGLGEAKKGGSGGKFTWGKPGMINMEEKEYLDHNDPNYDSDADSKADVKFSCAEAELSVSQLDQFAKSLISEFFEHADLRDGFEAVRSLRMSKEARPAFVSLLVGQAMDYKQAHRELSSQLIRELVYRRILTMDEVAAGLSQLLCPSELSDLCVDDPLASQHLGNFLGRCVADMAMRKRDLDAMTAESAEAQQALDRAKALLAQPAHRLHDVWGVAGGGRPVRQLSDQMLFILKEYLSSCDWAEAGRCLKELEVPHFHHELVFQASVLAVESMHIRVTQWLAELLQRLYSSGGLSADAISTGFERFFVALPDIALDVPAAYTIAEKWLQACQKAGGFLPPSLAAKMPQRGRKRFVSESDGGQLRVEDGPIISAEH